ncbi:FAD-dependent oxidoreductase [Bordetella genomosp. 9]|uniref:FAD-dependent oxidoreductase n=1 Tax=Bordetella genomosp. 9 TaxID=1416803 RepID=A0A261R5H2_9BORD|nr:NAD(P)/FAD-dependent oxidoreductase [Bordetella genomosp. 9]OZI19882.1 FAD-dependent oxidoreductase [Bordetella genomosp. 9]
MPQNPILLRGNAQPEQAGAGNTEAPAREQDARPPHRVVIVGGGAGGLELATELGRKHGRRHVTLIDSHMVHIWKPTLHEAAAGTIDVQQEGLSYLMLANLSQFNFVLGPMLGVDRARRLVQVGAIPGPAGEPLLPAREIPYDTLVIAVGSTSNFFGTRGAREHAITLDTPESAEQFRLTMLQAMVKVDQAKASDPRARLHIAIVGGGATGVELAAELHEASRLVAAYGLSNFDPRRDLAIRIIEGAPRILAALPEKLSHAAQRRLESLGIEIESGCLVSEVTADTVHTKDGRAFPAELCMWAAGIKGPDVLGALDLPRNRVGQLEVDARLQTEDPAIFAFGDCAAAPRADGRVVPARAQAAHQEASYLRRRLSARIAGQPEPGGDFVYKDRGSLVSLGRERGVGSLMGALLGRGFFISGLIARWMYASLHLLHHRTVLGFSRTVSLALARLLTRRTHPRVKLH